MSCVEVILIVGVLIVLASGTVSVIGFLLGPLFSPFTMFQTAGTFACTASDVIQPTNITESNRVNCDPSYPTVCIPKYPPDLDCGEISFRRFQVTGSDPHGFDGDNDGIGCESG